MRLVVLGCSGSFAGPDSPASGYLVQGEDDRGRCFNLVLDLGPGALGTLQRFIGITDIDAVVLSHLHPDHCLDLCGLNVALRYLPTGRPARRVPVYAPHGAAERIARAYGVTAPEDTSGQLEFHQVSDRVPLRLGPFRLEPFQVNHPVDAYGYRIDDGERTLAFTGDTDECAALSPLCRDVTLALMDSAFEDDRDTARGIHLTATRAARAALDAGGVGRLMLTHLPPWNDPQASRKRAATIWPGEVELARCGATYDL